VRYVPINPLLLATLKAVPMIEGCPYVFANPETGERWYDQETAWNYTIKRAELPGLRFHDLRHTFASRLVQMGTPIKAVQELLGHATMQMTLRYAHLAPGDLRRAVNLLVVGGAENSATLSTTLTLPPRAPKTGDDATSLPPADNGGPARTRTGNQGIMSPLL
jgi:hypothetical protein